MHKQNTEVSSPFSFKNKVGRVIWNVVCFLFFKTSPRPFHEWRSFLLRRFGATVGKGVHVYPGVKIWAPWNVELKDGCGIANGVELYSQGKITIGIKSVVSQDSYVCAGTHDYTQSSFPLITKPIEIGDQVWIASKVFIHPGVSIGNGSIIGACSVVTKDMPSWMICAGHPCKPIKERIMVS